MKNKYLVSLLLLTLLILAGCKEMQITSNKTTKSTLFIGIDVSGSFAKSRSFKDGVQFLSHYIYAHLKGVGNLSIPTDLYVGGIGGDEKEEPQAFFPIHDFRGRSIKQIRRKLIKEFSKQRDNLTDFNEFFRRVRSIVKQKNLSHSPLSLVLLTDGVAEVAKSKRNKQAIKQAYSKIDLSPVEYLTRNVSIRLIYTSPKVGGHWRNYVPTSKVKIWTVEPVVMKGWKDQIKLHGKKGLYKWIKDNIDLRIMSRGV